MSGSSTEDNVDKKQWIEARTAYLIRYEGAGEKSAPAIANGTADAHERIKGPDVSRWPAPTLGTVFNTRVEDDEDAS